MKKNLLIKILIIYFIFFIFYKNGIIACDLQISQDLKHQLFEDLKELTKTEKFKMIWGYHKSITDAFLWEFLDNYNLEREIKHYSILKQLIREEFCKYIIRKKTSEFLFITCVQNMLILLEIYIIMQKPSIIDIGQVLKPFGFIKNLFYKLNFSFKFIEIIKKFLPLILLKIVLYITGEPDINIFSLCIDIQDFKYYLKEGYRNAYSVFKTINYIDIHNNIDKDLLSNIKKFFIKK